MCRDDFYSKLQTAKRKYMERKMISTAPVGSMYRDQFGRSWEKIRDHDDPTKLWARCTISGPVVELSCAKLTLVTKPDNEKANTANKSDGSTADYYQLPKGSTQLQDLISHRNMNAQLGEIFRAAYRYGQASHSDQLRDAKKIKFYIEAEIKRLETFA